MNFHDEKILKIRFKGGEESSLRILPFRVEELPSFFALQDMESEEEAGNVYLDTLRSKTVCGEYENIIDTLLLHDSNGPLDTISNAFMALNFPPSKIKGKRKGRKCTDAVVAFTSAFDFLICQGHSYSDIQKYTLPQLYRFQDAVCDRMERMYSTEDPKTKDMGVSEYLSSLGVKKR